MDCLFFLLEDPFNADYFLFNTFLDYREDDRTILGA